MTHVWNHIIKIGAAIGGFIAGLYGGWTAAMTLLAIIMCVDYVTGCLCGFAGKSRKTEGGHWLSTVAFGGLAKKGLILLIVLVATRLDMVLGDGTSRTFQQMVTYYYIATEALSVIENAALLGVPVPKAFRKYFEVMKDNNDDSDE